MLYQAVLRSSVSTSTRHARRRRRGDRFGGFAASLSLGSTSLEDRRDRERGDAADPRDATMEAYYYPKPMLSAYRDTGRTATERGERRRR